MTDNEYDRAYRDPDVLTELYHEQGLSTREVAHKLDCSHRTVRRWMKKHEIERAKSCRASDHPACFRTNNLGYETWRTRDSGKQQCVLIHRLVCVAEHGTDALEGTHVHHKNEIPWDNRPENLVLMTPSEHARHHNTDQTSPSPPAGNGQTTITAYIND